MASQKRLWLEKYKDKRGIPIEDVVLLYSNGLASQKGAEDIYIGNIKRGDGHLQGWGPGKYSSSAGAVYTAFHNEYSDDQRIISLLCDIIQAMCLNSQITPKRVIEELRKIDFFYHGAFPQIPGDHAEPED